MGYHGRLHRLTAGQQVRCIFADKEIIPVQSLDKRSWLFHDELTQSATGFRSVLTSIALTHRLVSGSVLRQAAHLADGAIGIGFWPEFAHGTTASRGPFTQAPSGPGYDDDSGRRCREGGVSGYRANRK